MFVNPVALVLMEPQDPLLGVIDQLVLLLAPAGRLVSVAVRVSAAAPACRFVDPEVVRPAATGVTVICTVAVLVESAREVAVA